MKMNLIKTMWGLIPEDLESKEKYDKIKSGAMVTADIKLIRNAAFLRKYFALLHIGFDNWTPEKINSDYGAPEKNFERFRKDTTILAGYYRVVIRVNGDARVEAKSISFANMEEEEFDKLYNATINVLLKHIYKQSITQKELDNTVNQYLSFT